LLSVTRHADYSLDAAYAFVDAFTPDAAAFRHAVFALIFDAAAAFASLFRR